MSKDKDNKVLTLEEESKEKEQKAESKQKTSVFEKKNKEGEQESQPKKDAQPTQKEENPREVKTLPEQPLVFEITYKSSTNTEGDVCYTSSLPEFATNGNVYIKQAFGRHDFKENVLNKQTVTESCKKDLAEGEFVIDAQEGLMIKAIEPQEWMSRDLEETETIFNQKVLTAFRTAQDEITRNMIEAEKAKHKAAAQQQQHPQTQYPPQEQNATYGSGNIPVDPNRPQMRDL